MKILLIRHGDPDYAHDTLTAKGQKEAALLADRLSRMQIDDFYLSPLGRAQATAQPTLEKMHRQGETLPWLREFRGHIIDPSTGEKRCAWNLMPQYWTIQPDLKDPDAWRQHGLYRAGDVAEVYDETAAGMDALLLKYGYVREGALYRCEQNDTRTIALFCHLGISLAILSHLLLISPAVLWHSFFLPTTSITTLITEERVKGQVWFCCMGLGDASHLQGQGDNLGRAGLFPECFGEGSAKPAQ